MKLKKLHLFLILLGVLAVGCLGVRVVEGLETKGGNDANSSDSKKDSLLGSNDSQTSTNLASNSDDSNNLETYGNVEEDGNFTSASGPSYFNTSDDGPEGVPASNIPPGDEDLYVLKSEIVPPICPAPTNAIFFLDIFLLLKSCNILFEEPKVSVGAVACNEFKIFFCRNV